MLETAMRLLSVLLVAAALCASAFAAQNGTIAFDLPNTGGAPTGYRIYRDGTLIGAVTPGQSITALSPIDVGTITIGVESFNVACGATPLPACARVNKQLVLGPPPVQPPGPVRNLQITLSCATTTPPTCTVTVTDVP